MQSNSLKADMPFSSRATITHLNPLLLLRHPQNAFPSKPITTTTATTCSSSPTTIPTHEDIASLILQQKTPGGALRTFRWASQLPSFRHDATTYRALVRALVGFRRYDAAKRVLLREIPAATGSPPDDDDTFVALVRGLARARMTREAAKVVDLMPSPSLKVFNSVLDVLVKEDIDLARVFFREKMAGSGFQGDEYTYGILMKGLCRTNRIAEGFKLLKLMKSRGLPPNPVVYNTLIHALCKNGKLGIGRARSLMSEMRSPSGVTFNIMISAYCGEGNLIQALVMLEKSFNLGFVPDVVAVTKIVEVLCSEGRNMEAVELLERVEEKGGVVDVVAYNTLIEGFCKMGKPKVGRRVVKEMESKGCLPNVRTYNALILGFCVLGDVDSAADVFRELEMDGIGPDFQTFDTIISGFCLVGRVKDGLKFLDLMAEHRGDPGERISPYNSIVYGLYRESRLEEAEEFLEKMGRYFPRAVDRSLRILSLCRGGLVEEAKKVYDQMVGEGGVPSMLVYVCLVDGLCREGSMCEAFDLVNEMVGRGCVPLSSTFNSLISGFCQEGNVGSALKLLEEMIYRSCSPNTASYSPLIDALCRQGDLQKAFGLLMQMVGNDILPDATNWESLLLSLCQRTPWPDSQHVIHLNSILNCICQS